MFGSKTIWKREDRGQNSARESERWGTMEAWKKSIAIRSDAMK